MKTTMIIDKNTEKELEELSSIEEKPKSKIIREAINDLYLKERRAKENILFFVDLYNKGILTKDLLLLLLTKKDAAAIIIGSKTGKEAVDIAKSINS